MGSLAKVFFAEGLQSFCGNSKTLRRFAKIRFIALGKGAEILQKVVEISWKFAEVFFNDPFPNDPISELLIIGIRLPLQLLL